MFLISLLSTLILFCCLTLTARAGDVICPAHETCLEEAVTLYKNGDIAEALARFKYIADWPAEFSDPATAGVSSFMSGYIMGQLMSEGAEPYLEQANSTYPLIGDYALYRLAEVVEKRGGYDKSADIYKKIYKSYPDSALRKKALLKTADTSLMAGRIREARDTYKSYMRSYPADGDIPDVLYGIGLSYLREDKVSPARDYFKRIWVNYPASAVSRPAKEWVNLPLDPKDIYTRGERLYDAGLYSDAIDEYKRFLSGRKGISDTKKMEAYFRIGMANSNLRRLKEAEEGLELFLNKYPRHPKAPEALYWLGRTYLREGKEDAFIKSGIGYLKRYKKDGRGPEVLYRLGNIFAEKRDIRTATYYYERVIKEYPLSSFASDSLWAKGWLLYKGRDIAGALEVFDNILQNSDEPSYTPQAAYWRAKVLEKMGDYQGMEKGLCRLCSEYRQSFYCLFSRYYYNFTCAPVYSDETGISQRDTKEDENAAVGWAPPTEKDMGWWAMPPLHRTLSGETHEDHHFARIKLFFYLGLKEEALNEILWVRNDINGDKEKAILIASILSSIGEYHRALYTIREYIPGNMSAGMSIDARLWRLIYPEGYNDLIKRYGDENKVDPLMLYALIREESWFNKDAVSPAGAVGLMQLMPKTAAMLAKDSYKGRDSLFDPELNIGLGTRFFADRLKQFDGNIFVAIASYNAGPDAVSQWLKEREGFELDEFIEDMPYRETRNYVKKVFRSYMEYQRLN